MIWLFRFLLVVLLLLATDITYGLLGILLSRFRYGKHPWLHRSGLRLLAMSELFGKRLLPGRCELCCSVDQCGNWTCEKYHKDPRR